MGAVMAGWQCRNPSATADGTDLIGTARLLIQQLPVLLNQLAQQLKGVRPFVAEKSGDAPQYRQGLDCSRCFSGSHIQSFPAKLIEYLGHCFLCRNVVSANEHGRAASLQSRVDHQVAAYGIESFNEARVRK